MSRFFSYIGVFLLGALFGIFMLNQGALNGEGLPNILNAKFTPVLFEDSKRSVQEVEIQIKEQAVDPAQPEYIPVYKSKDEKKLGIYTVQVASFPKKRQADAFAKELRLHKIDAFVSPNDVATKRGWYRVFAGKYTSKRDANLKWRELRMDFPDSFVRLF